MNLYILVEGKHTERIVYPKWLSYIAPHLTKKDSPSEVFNNDYFLISGEGYPRLLDITLKNSIDDIISLNRFDYFVVILDVDETTSEYRKKEVNDRINELGIDLKPCKIKVIPQNKCIETWGLGNKTIFARNTDDQILKKFYEHYNVSIYDPEDMEKPIEYENSVSNYHEAYLKRLLRAKRIHYSKKNPQDFAKAYYLEQLILRIQNFPEHLKSFQEFYSFFSKL